MENCDATSSWPAIAMQAKTIDLGDGRIKRRLKDELLHPEHEPANVLLEMGPIAFSAQSHIADRPARTIAAAPTISRPHARGVRAADRRLPVASPASGGFAPSSRGCRAS